jgi:hypothetical protein
MVKFQCLAVNIRQGFGPFKTAIPADVTANGRDRVMETAQKKAAPEDGL